MKKICARWVFTLLVLTEACAFADAMIPITTYKCLVCEKKFYAFQGDDLDTEELNDPDIQPTRVFTLADRGKNFPNCGSFKAHVFDQQETMLRPMSEIAKNASRIAVVKGGPNLNGVTISQWWCLANACNAGPFYTLNEDKLIQKDWEQQPDRIISLKGSRKISRCKLKWVYGHPFVCQPSYKKASVKSYDIAQLAYDIYYVK